MSDYFTLREANDKDQVDDDPSQQVSSDHVVDHHNKRPNYLKASEITK